MYLDPHQTTYQSNIWVQLRKITISSLPTLLWPTLNPMFSAVFLTIFRVFLQTYNDLLVLSLGTGQQTVGYDAKEIAKWGVVDWLVNKGEAPLVDMVFNASADMVDYNLSIIFQSQDCSHNYLRIQVYIHLPRSHPPAYSFFMWCFHSYKLFPYFKSSNIPTQTGVIVQTNICNL